ncbi:DsrE family protein [uncultured Ferrimonas sp.]|uniref:DsrE family protein n=1 Tax=uncultured Ferrimonas sp. TaxID=432640 RepID=UPI0026043F6D|nr:DsrE family protein [uncultured Ferrimonas sp.]
MKPIFFLLLAAALPASAGLEMFTDGPVIKGYGKHATITPTLAPPKDFVAKVAFDAGSADHQQPLNRQFDTVARFLNMHAASGVERNYIQPALVVHGKAVFDLLKAKPYQQRFDQANPNQPLVNALIAADVPIIVCGQSAAYLDINAEDLLPGVQLALSAMTAHRILAQQGYSTNPF